MEATIRELRASTKEILRAVNRGDTILVTNRGKPCARIVPFFDRGKRHNQDPLFGIWRGNKDVKSVKGYIQKMRKGRYAR